MSLYEGLSLAVSLVGTLFSIVLGLRQLRLAPPARPADQPVLSVPGPTYGPGPSGPGSSGPGSLGPSGPVPSAAAGRAWVPGPAVLVRDRPRAVTLASVFLYGAAAVQVMVLVGGWTYTLLDTSDGPFLSRLGPDVWIDLLAFGAVGVTCALIGLFVARGSRVAAWLTWLLGVLGLGFFAFLALALLGFAIDPDPVDPAVDAGGIVYAAIYLVLLGISFIVSASLLFTPGARAFRRKVRF